MDLESILHPSVTQPLMVTPRHASAVDEQEEDFDEQTGRFDYYFRGNDNGSR